MSHNNSAANTDEIVIFSGGSLLIGMVIFSHPGSLGKSGILVDSGHIAPPPLPDGTDSVLKHHTPRTRSLCSHIYTLCTNTEMFITQLN